MPAPLPATFRGRAAATLQRAWQGPRRVEHRPVARGLGVRSDRVGKALAVRARPARVVAPAGAGRSSSATSSSAAPARRRPVLAIVELFRANGYAPGIVSRGYGRAGAAWCSSIPTPGAAEVGDEPLLLRRRSGVPVAVGVDRVAAGHALLRAHARDRRHRQRRRPAAPRARARRRGPRLRRTRVPAMAASFPRALARAAAGSPRPRQLVLYNADAPTTPLPGHLATRWLAGVTPLADWWQGAPPSAPALATLSERQGVVAVAGTARPERFFAMLRSRGVAIVERPLKDHSDFSVLPWPAGSADVVVTEKDAVKLPPTRPLGTRVWVARLDFVPDPAFDAALLALLAPLSSPEPHGNSSA
jgi:tetraacyldisaccharide 4'-kinase